MLRNVLSVAFFFTFLNTSDLTINRLTNLLLSFLQLNCPSIWLHLREQKRLRLGVGCKTRSKGAQGIRAATSRIISFRIGFFVRFMEASFVKQGLRDGAFSLFNQHWLHQVFSRISFTLSMSNSLFV